MELPPPPPPAPPPPVPVMAAKGRVAGDEEENNRYVPRPRERDTRAFRLVPLHECDAGMLERVSTLLSERWPKGDRGASSQMAHSCDAFPTSLVLLESDNAQEPLGHLLLSRCLEDDRGLLAESVLVAAKLRGMGVGGRLMELMHAYARSKGFATVYLSTRDKRDFYMHLGYRPIERAVTARKAVGEGLDAEGLDKLKSVFGTGGGGQWAWLAFTL
jgi:predicted N-acetyltransferase YhbS